MKICLVSNLYKPFARGGAEVVVEKMIKGLQQKTPVILITTKPTAELEIEEQQDLKIYRFKPWNIFYYLDANKKSVLARLVWHFFNLFNVQSALHIFEILRKEKPNVVITHNLMGIGFLVPIVLRYLDIPHVHVLHDVQLAVPSGLIIKGQEKDFIVNGFLARGYAWICKNLFGSPQAIVSPSQWLLNFYERRGFFKKSEKLVLKNPVEGSYNVDVSPTWREQKEFLFLGQIETHKGIEWLLDFWEQHKVSHKLWIVGDGSLFERLKESNSTFDNIRFLGRLEQPALNNICVQSDFMILPSLCYENSPTVVGLAYRFGVPVLGANIGGIPELIKHGKTGFLFEPGDGQSFKENLDKILQRNYDEFSANCVARVENWGLDSYIDKIINLCYNLVR